VTSKRKEMRDNFLLLFGSIIFAATLAEIGLRIILPAPIVWKYPQEHYLYDPEIGHRLEANQRSFTHDKIVRTNSIGIRDIEYTPQAPDNVYRILALGDSQTFGNGLNLADTWPKQLELILNVNSNDVRVEVLNCGLPASDSWQHAIIFHRLLAKYNPDAAILAFYVNDVVRRHTPSQRQQNNSGELRTRLTYILKQSALLLSLRKALHSIQEYLNPGKALSRQQALMQGINDLDIEEGWRQVEQSLSEIKKTSDEEDIVFLLVSLPRRDQVDGRIPADRYINRLQSIAEGHQIPVIDMLGPLHEAYKEHGNNLFIPWDGHNSGITNRVIAFNISRVLSIQKHGKH
jgi:hypothetical protein